MSPGKERAEGGEQRSVGSSVPDAVTKLALEDPHLVTEGDQFEVPVPS